MQTNASQETPLMQGNTPHTSTSQEDTLAQPNFSYHAVLPQLDVPVAITPDTTKPAKQLTNADAKAKDAATTPATTTKLGKFNAFQVGSYKTQAQATAMQARLKQNGLATHVEKAEVNGQDYFRIKLGPATSAEVYNKWQQTLSSMGINPLPIHL
jgi:cell division protein FtsN